MNILGSHYIYMGEIKPADSMSLNTTINEHEIYEVIRIEDGILLFEKNHLQRLYSGFSKLNITPPFTNNEIIDSIHELILTENVKNENVKISCFIDNNKNCQYYIYIIPSSYPSEWMYSHGISTVLLKAERANPNIKIANTKVRKTAITEIEKQHTFEALLVNYEEYITEGSRTNLFFIMNGVIYTAPSDKVLKGIIRSKVIDIIHKTGYILKMECLHISQIDQIESAFVTGTSSRILPINQIEHHPINVNHPLLKNLMKLLSLEIEHYKIKNAGTK